MSATTGYGSRSFRPRKRSQAESEGESEDMPSNVPKKARTGEGDPGVPNVARTAATASTETATSVPANEDDQLSAYLKASRSSLSMSDAAPLAVPVSTPPEATTSPATHETTDEVTDEEEVEEVKEATETEKQWWSKATNPGIDKSRLPLRLVTDVTYTEFVKKCARANTGRFWDFRDGTVIVIELPSATHEGAGREFEKQFITQTVNHNLTTQDGFWSSGSLTCTDQTTGMEKEPDASFAPERLPMPAPNPCNSAGYPWPTIVVESAESETLPHVQQKVTSFWLAPNRCEDAVILKLGVWSSRYDNSGVIPLRHLTCYHYCRRRSPQVNGVFQPIAMYEFGTAYSNGRHYTGCSALGMQVLTLDPACLYAGCPGVPPYPIPAPGIVIDLYHIQCAIFRMQGP